MDYDNTYITSCLVFKVSALCDHLAYYIPLTFYFSFMIRQDMQRAIDYCVVIYYGLDILYARVVLYSVIVVMENEGVNALYLSIISISKFAHGPVTETL